MKKTYTLFLAIGLLYTACFKTEIPPELKYTGPAPNMTIARFQQLHQLGTTNPATLIDTNVIITGVVTSTDQYGSCYKEIFIQDSTGGVSIRMNNPSYYKKYPIGQRLFVHAKGLYLGNYISSGNNPNNGVYQLSLLGGEGGTQYISSNVENRSIYRSGFPEVLPAPKIISTQNDIISGAGGDYHTLATLKNCYFEAANGSVRYYEKQGTGTTISRNVRFNMGAGLVQARISEFCTFGNDILPTGALNITGILTQFGASPQLIICSIHDVEIIIDLKSYDMNTNPFHEGWKNEIVKGDREWNYNAGFKNVNIQVPQGNESECWFVSPKFNFSGKKDVALVFNYSLTAGSKENFEVLYCVNGVNWQRLDFTPQIGSTVDGIIKLEDNIATSPNLQIAFKYKTTDVYPVAVLNNIAFRDNVR
jgi:hypothetical protein